MLGLKAVNCRNGDLLAQEQVTASGKEQVLRALGDAATKLRQKLGESLASVQKYDVPPEEVTTSSLDALQAYSLGYRAYEVRDDSVDAIPFLERAVNLDPNFAMGYVMLGAAYQSLGESVRAVDNTREAYALQVRTSQHEKLVISSSYERLATGNLEAAAKSNTLWVEIYPRNYMPRLNLSAIYESLGNYEMALATAKETLRLNPRGAAVYLNLVWAYQFLNLLDESTATAEAAKADNFDSPRIHVILYFVDFLRHDSAGMKREAAGLMGKRFFENSVLYVESDTAAYAGEFAKARELTRRAGDSAQREDEKESAAAYKAEASVREAFVGNVALAMQDVHAALALANSKATLVLSAIALGLTGDALRAARLAADLSKQYPEDTSVQYQYVPMIRGAIALGGNSGDKAVEALAMTAPYELGYFFTPVDFALYSIYLRGQAYLASRHGTEAAVEFQKILDHPGVVVNEPIGALAHLGLGRAYALAGDTSKAKTAYQDFFALWKNADPDIPILLQAKAEYAKLK